MVIEITKEVIFKDNEGNILRVFPVGTLLEATAESDHYFVTPMGGIFKSEAKPI